MTIFGDVVVLLPVVGGLAGAVPFVRGLEAGVEALAGLGVLGGLVEHGDADDLPHEGDQVEAPVDLTRDLGVRARGFELHRQAAIGADQRAAGMVVALQNSLDQRVEAIVGAGLGDPRRQIEHHRQLGGVHPLELVGAVPLVGHLAQLGRPDDQVGLHGSRHEQAVGVALEGAGLAVREADDPSAEGAVQVLGQCLVVAQLVRIGDPQHPVGEMFGLGRDGVLVPVDVVPDRHPQPEVRHPEIDGDILVADLRRVIGHGDGRGAGERLGRRDVHRRRQGPYADRQLIGRRRRDRRHRRLTRRRRHGHRGGCHAVGLERDRLGVVLQQRAPTRRDQQRHEHSGHDPAATHGTNQPRPRALPHPTDVGLPGVGAVK
ncbi:hypothetical protein KOI35_24235 [Actinoplanes bogorensis]|uniref:Uncharacterized protein n=1 Tax=Paractinoplanes bogorensis TaxID=1610840 RepID=A0ABS5YT38_9ACTN|nr:hypothetical protein [Actinoplanes bogorensis]MBU2666622.1 hypothetical protein [Actinoplanes bogorensis]